MILDKTENLHLYAGVSPYIYNVVEFIASHDLLTMPTGRVEICGDDLFANFDTAHGKPQEEAVMESHNRMADIQLILDNEETVGWAPRKDLPSTLYDEERDISFYPGCAPQEYVKLRPGTFLLFLPDDAHAPCISERESYRKVIFKMRVK